MQDSVDLIRVRSVRDRFPKEGLFAEKDWLVAPEPFFLDAKSPTSWNASVIGFLSLSERLISCIGRANEAFNPMGR